MKKPSLILISILFASRLFAQDCTSCDGTISSGPNSSAIGKNTSATGLTSFASGFASEATGSYSTALGFYSFANYTKAVSIGSAVKATSEGSMVIGSGSYSLGHYLENNTPRSLVVSFYSIYPTLSVREPLNQNVAFDKTGRVAIGNVVDQYGIINPQAKLHIKADQEEPAAVLIEPNSWSAGEEARLIMGDTDHFIRTENNSGMLFNSKNNFIFNGMNMGLGVEDPQTKLHLDGDLLFENNINGIIMKSEDGNCWKGTISNGGELVFTQVDCETLLSGIKSETPKHADIFIYPNPTHGMINVEYTGNKKDLRLEVKTIAGHLIGTHKLNKGENRIALNNIAEQLVIVSVYTQKGALVSTSKVLIDR